MEPRPYDLLLKSGRVVDPANRTDGIFDIAISGGRIAAVEADINPALACEVFDVENKLITPGLIDTHAHVFEHVTGSFGLNPDSCGIRAGVTTLVDQGGPSLMTLPAFRNYVADPADSRVLCFLSAYLVGGLEGHHYPQLYGPEDVDVKRTIEIGLANLDLVKGIKAHAEVGGKSRWGMEVIKQARDIARGIGVPLYIHLGQIWPEAGKGIEDPDTVIEELVPLMKEGDILAHPFTRHPGGFISSKTGELHPIVRAGLDRGLKVDVGHGSHFSFDMARKVIEAGILPHTLGADMHGYNTDAGQAKATDFESSPFFGKTRFCLTHAMTELLALGVSLNDVVSTVTSNAAGMLGIDDESGSLSVGKIADIAILEHLTGRFTLSDNSGASVIGTEAIRPVFSLREGVRFDVDSPVIVDPMELAG
ncbi:amidohydrolase/deacetylase family metallohydrolase [Marinobacter sp. F3R08]|uniref:amidohydrolase/deacetylase family metallohydrolase n=1 Tax=Marinobacter sp. F3R08 TaxID=2841559 RepID=UPI001C0855A1|nr:amidohydrolase/deacetylase family metallohydrolase [Marinobacter sp. F3R08]MBU2955877.1 amidohydrolase/deacetylase family metallohydrolase [Marinobacter sp. F3R08]